MKPRLLLRRIASFSLAVAVFGLAFAHWPEFRESLANVQPGWAGAGILVYYLNYLLRALRLRFLLPGKLAFWPDGVWIACFHGTTTYLFPMRTGDLSLPVLLKSHCGVDLTTAGRVLVKARLLDVASLGCLTTLAALCLPAPVSPAFRVAWVGAGATMVLFSAFVRLLTRHSGSERHGFFRKLVAFGRVSKFRRNEFWASMGIWLAISGGLYCASRAIHLPVGVGGILFLVTVQLPLQLLPVQGIANAGNHEGGWVAALSMLGIPADAALRFALTSHALLLVYVLAISPVLLLPRVFRSAASGTPGTSVADASSNGRETFHSHPRPAEADHDDRSN